MRPDYAEHYRTLWEKHWWWRSREAFVVTWLDRVAARSKIRRILDVGCGDGLFFSRLEAFGTVDGLEADATLLDQTNPTARIHVGKLDQAFRPGPVYDLLVMLDVLEHIEDDREALEIAYGAIRPGGRILITVPALSALWSRHDEVNQHYRRYGLGELRSRLTEAGFEVETLRYFFAWTVVPLLFRRWLKPALGQTNPASSDYKVGIPPKGINRLLATLSRIDHWVATRFRWPLGSSILAIAVRCQTNPASTTPVSMHSKRVSAGSRVTPNRTFDQRLDRSPMTARLKNEAPLPAARSIQGGEA